MQRRQLPLALVLPLAAVAVFTLASPSRAHPADAKAHAKPVAACADKLDATRLHPTDVCYAEALAAAYRREVAGAAAKKARGHGEAHEARGERASAGR